MTTKLRDRAAALAGEVLEIRNQAHEQADHDLHKEMKALYRALCHPAAICSTNAYEALLARLRAETRAEALATAWTDYSRFKRALASGNAMVSWAAALELEAITLPDALRLLLLVRDSDLARYERAAVRFHARLCQQARLSLGEAELGLAALCAIGGPAGSLRGWR